MSEPAISPAIEVLIGTLIDGRIEPAGLATLTVLAREHAAIRRVLRAHLLISEISSQLLAPERGAEPFFAGLVQRQRSELDAQLFTRRVMRSVEMQRGRTLRGATRALLEVVSLSAAALLMLGLLSLSTYALVRVGAQHATQVGRRARDGVLTPIDLASVLARNQELQ